MVNKQLYIGGEWRDATGGATLEVFDPSTEEPLCEVADATPEDCEGGAGSAWRPEGVGGLAAERPGGNPWKAFEALMPSAPTSLRCS